MSDDTGKVIPPDVWANRKSPIIHAIYAEAICRELVLGKQDPDDLVGLPVRED